MLALVLSVLLNLLPGSTIATNDTTAAPYVIVNHIIIEGNLKTKEQMILRELDITAGDTLKSLQKEAL